MRKLRQKFNLILTLALWLVAAQTAWAATVEETVTWPMSTGCSVSSGTLSNTAGNRMVLNNNMIWEQTSDRTGIATYQYNLVTSTYNTEISFPDIEGTVTAVEIKNFSFEESGMNLYAGTSMSSLLNKSTGGTAYASGNSSNYSGNVTYTGTMNVTSSSPLKLMFRAASSTLPEMQMFQFAPNDAWHTAGYISVTYQKEVPADPQHTFSTPSVNGNTLTVTCTNSGAGHECSLTNRQATLTLTANDGSVSGFQFDAPSLNLMEFNNQTGLGATAGTITYTYKSTGETINSAMFVYKSGAYTASVTVTVGGNNYTLTKDFELYDATVNNSYAQFSISPTALRDGDVVTITFTPQLGESVEMLTLTGNNTTLTLGNGITDHHDGTYTFTMPRDILTLSATFNFPLNENDITKNESGDTYTIKTAEGWDYFCRRILFDKSIDGFKGKTIELTNDITVTATMAGNYEHRFKGTFDGKGYTLTFNPTSVGQYTAPFYCTDGATIRNLHATGCIQAGDFQNCGGMVGLTNGNLTIENCRVSTQISSTYSGNAGHGGFVGFLSSQYNQCHITGCVFDGLIYNPYYSGTTYGCGGFIGAMSEYGYAILEDCLFIHGQYDNNGGKHELWWGNENNKNSTFLHRTNNQGSGKLTNCFYVGTRGLKQGSPAVESATAPTNFAHFGDPTNHRFMQTYGHMMVFGGKYYTPPYGDLVETYDYSGVKSYNIEYDDKPLGIPDITTQLWVPLLRYKRTFTNGKPVTVMMPFNFTKSAFKKSGSSDGLTGHFYEFKGINGSAPVMESANEVTEMKANTPYIYVPDEEPEYWYIDNGGSGVNIFTEGYDGGNKVTPYDGFEMRGTYTEKVWEENDPEIGKAYLIGDGGELIPVTAGTKIRPTECYIIQTAWAQGVTYLDENGTGKTCSTYTTMTSSTTSLEAGWYVVNDDVTISDRITVSGTVNLILTNNATLTASKGITVGSDATLNIYAQTDDEATMGALVADGTNDKPNWYAGIGGVENTDAGMITINGGQINATGWCAAGIGSGGGTSTVGTITINGGIVTAQDNAHYGAGIGGGFSGGKAGTINLNGGVINAAGIGSGYFGGDCSITVNISDGVKKIVATPVQGGACIGKGASASGTVTVNFKSGGNVVTGDAKDAVFYDTGEGAQRQVRAKAMNHAVTMSDDLKANITATSEYAFTGETVTLTLGTAVDATTLSVNDGAVATTDAGNRQYTFTMPDGDVTVTATLLQTYAVSLPANMEVVSATNAADADGKYITGTTVTFKASFPYAASNVSYGTSTLEPDANGIYTVTVADADVTITATVERSATIDLTDAPGDFNAIEGDVLTGTTSHTVTIAADAGITLSGATISGGIVCEGTATITLVGTNSVNVNNVSASSMHKTAGIQIGGSGTTLTIRGDGSLTATGGSQAAGIGLGRTWDASVTAGVIVIEGGTVNASGDIGIGIGTVGNSQTATIDGISIKGGTVSASLGKGYIYNGCTATVGYIKIYDTIDMVDASKITESVTYMHDDTDVTASASDYFTIIENGNRRIIVPKDDNDYTITIADGIEHGTLTVAETAKYMETVTVTATPAFGYRFVRLIVKDAQNNDVASTGNTFQMPKGGATVSAVFEQGTHGTMEFVWGYPGPDSFVNEATIYDGVTTVNIQNTEVSYNILKNEGNTYYKFLLDNNTYDADIPYAGGTGEFYGAGNGTNFYIPGNGQTGYYDITLTDVGNGKWGVSILPTVAQMDVVPDQTYTGSAITPEPLVIAGSLSLTKGTDYVYSYTNNTNVGTAKVRATFQGTYSSLGYVEKEFTILPSTVMVSVTGSGTVTCGDRSATDGTSFGVMSEKGASVVLTLAPTDGYAVKSVAYGYTNNSGTTASGLKLPINGTTATLTVPNDLKDGTYVTMTVSFVSALVGGADEASAVALTDATVTDLGGGWYKVENDISFDHTLNLLADTYLTIAEGKTMSVNTTSGKAIDSEYTLNVSGEGALNITTTKAYEIAVRVGSYVQTGATVTANGYIGIRCKDNFDEFNVTNDFTFSGGQLTATGSGGDGIWADNDITLSCTNATDFIQASSYSSVFGAVKIADGKALTDGTEASNGMNGYSGTLTYEQRTAIGGKTLHRAVTTSYVDATGTLHENVTAMPLDDTMTTLAAGWYVVNSNVNYTGQITLGGNVNIILADGKTMTVTNTGTGNEDFAIYGDSGSLHIYGQSQGTGALTATANSSVTIKVDDYITINGGTVTATSTSDVGIYGIDGVTINGGTVNANGIYADGDITINGGKVTNNSDPGIRSNNGTIILGLRNATDYITAESYSGAVKIADGKTLVDENGTIWSGTLNNDQIENGINDRTLRPVMGVVLTKDGSGNISAEFDGTSLETVSIPVNITVNSVTLNRTFTHDKCATLMLPFSLSDGQSLNGGTLYKFDGVNNGEGDWVATLSEFTSPLKANTPYLIKPNGYMTDDKITFDLKGGTVTLNTTTAGEDSNEKDDLWDFIGTYSYIKWTSDTGDQDYSTEREAEIGKVYGFAAVEKTGIHVGDFVRVASGAKIRPMCAYLKWKGSIPNNARALTRGAANDDTELPQRITVRLVGANGEVTNIGTISMDNGQWIIDNGVEGDWYSLDGRKLNGKPATKGVYINNGKKVVIKDSQSAFTKCND